MGEESDYAAVITVSCADTIRNERLGRFLGGIGSMLEYSCRSRISEIC